MSRANKQVVFLGYVQLIVIGRTITEPAPFKES